MPLGMVWPLTVVVPLELETTTLPMREGMRVLGYCTVPSGPNW
jgi:hypothetical protein